MTETGFVYVIGTFDTKAEELNYAAKRVAAAGAVPLTVDISTTPFSGLCDVPAAEVAKHHPLGAATVFEAPDRGLAVTAMGAALAHYLSSRENIAAVLGLGGSGNTSMVTKAMQSLAVGVPKLMVSTLASGNVAPFVGASDITIMHSVADIAGLNAITRQIIGNAAHAVAGMATHTVPPIASTKRHIGLTMFGVTTQAITSVRSRIEQDAECFVFHATGSGGRCFEKLIDSGFLNAAIDLTTTEVADHLCGGILACDDDRFGAIIRTGIPYVGSVGAVDMVNFGSQDSVPASYAKRQFYIHNPTVTLMRTTAQENTAIGMWIVERLNKMQGPVRFLLPLKGVSAIDKIYGPFYNVHADEALFAAIRKYWKASPNRKLVEVNAHINDQSFAEAVVENFHEIIKTSL